MSRLIHLSDLHFGTDRPELEAPLVEFIKSAQPDLVIVSGDLTQRARKSQFARARAFLDRLETPWIAVPGNHDTPLDNLALRLLRPYGRFRKAMGPDLEPWFEGSDFVAAGINTVDPHRWQSGKLRRKALRAIETRLVADKLGVVVMHHPPEQAIGDRKRPMKGAYRGLGQLERMGADLVLCGHLHVWRAMPFRATSGLLLVQAGTGLSTRLRNEPNDFNVIEVGPGSARVQRHGAAPGQPGFTLLSDTAFIKENGRWRVLG